MKSTTKKLVSCALCIAIGVLLPMAFHVIPNGGSVFLPMHIPVLICGLFCGWPYGLACGILTPFISSVTTGMPPAMILPQMMVELAVYGLVAGLCTQYISMKNEMTKLYMSLIIAMLAGRIVNGFVNTSWSYLPNGFLVGKGGFSRYREKISAVMPVSGEATVMW